MRKIDATAERRKDIIDTTILVLDILVIGGRELTQKRPVVIGKTEWEFKRS